MKNNTYTEEYGLIIPNGFEDIMHKLSDNRVFGLEFIDDALHITELCDEWFCMKLTKEDCLELSNMFKFISDNFS